MTPDLRTLDGTKISRFCFGAMQFGGGNADRDESAAMYGACREAGINFFDTANGYTDGDSETYLGELAGAERDKVFVATKCAGGTIATPEVINKEIAQSRERSGLEVIDLYYLHRWDTTTPLDETFGCIADLVKSGVVRHVGVSNYAAWQVVKAQQVAERHGIRIDVLQPMYNLVKRIAEVEILPMAQSEGIAIFPYSPLGGGLLTGKYAKGQGGRLRDNKMYAERYDQSWMFDAAEELSEIAADVGIHPATLAVAWVARSPGVTAPIISARSLSQLQPSLDAVSYEMDDALYERLCGLVPTPPPATDRLEEA